LAERAEQGQIIEFGIRSMSVKGQDAVMSAFHPKADIADGQLDVR